MVVKFTYKLAGYIEYLPSDAGFVTPVFIDSKGGVFIQFISEQNNNIDWEVLPTEYQSCVITKTGTSQIEEPEAAIYGFKWNRGLFFADGDRMLEYLSKSFMAFDANGAELAKTFIDDWHLIKSKGKLSQALNMISSINSISIGDSEALIINQFANMKPEREAFKRKIFISFPDQEPIKTFVDSILRNKISETYSKILPICFLDFEQNGDFTKIIFDEIAFSNAIVAFIKDLNSNVLFEIGRATALGKPYIAIAPRGITLPSLIKRELTIFYDGDTPSTKTIEQIMSAIEKAVIRPSHRETLDARQRHQHKLLTGMRSIIETGNDSLQVIKNVDEFKPYLNAQKEFRYGNFNEAIGILLKSIQEGYKLEHIYHLIADSFFLLGEGADTQFEADNYYDEMLKISQEGLILFPKSNAIRKDYAVALQKCGRYTDAKTIFDQLLIESNEPVYLYNLACLHCLLSNEFECLKYLDKAINKARYYQTLARMDPDFENMWKNEMFQALLFQRKFE